MKVMIITKQHEAKIKSFKESTNQEARAKIMTAGVLYSVKEKLPEQHNSHRNLF